MPRFSATISGGTFKVEDTLHSATVLSMNEADLHTPGGGGSGVQIAPAISLQQIDRAFGTPYAIEREMGFDLHFDFDNSSGSAKEMGSFHLENMVLATPFQLQNTYLPQAPETITGGFSRSVYYPNSSYSPLVILRDASTYNICAALCYPVIKYNHPIYFEPSGGNGNVDVKFELSDHPLGVSPPPATWYTIPAGQKRRYTLMFRINDRTNTNIGPATDAAQEWLWTLRGYQTYFRRLYGKPNYRRMGGWNGRPIASFNSSPGNNNPRRYGNANAANPTLNGATSGDPDGFFKIAKVAEDMRGRNLPRIMFWALSGQHPDPGPPNNYDFRFATQVASLDAVGDGVGPTTVQPALRNVRDRMQLGLWWGRSTDVDDSTSWDVSTPEHLDLSDPHLVDTAYAEMTLAVNRWNAQMIGLDAFETRLTPALGPAWLRRLQGRFPHAFFVTELALPDVFHVIAPTFFSEIGLTPTASPFWLHHYINPGGAAFMNTGIGTGSQNARATALAGMGYEPITQWGVDISKNLSASLRWRELGERAVSHFQESTAR